jgi:hypothetical protein
MDNHIHIIDKMSPTVGCFCIPFYGLRAREYRRTACENKNFVAVCKKGFYQGPAKKARATRNHYVHFKTPTNLPKSQ